MAIQGTGSDTFAQEVGDFSSSPAKYLQPETISDYLFTRRLSPFQSGPHPFVHSDVEELREIHMRVSVRGATDFIGARIVPELIGAGHQVLSLARSDAGVRFLAAAGLMSIAATWKIRDAFAVAPLRPMPSFT
jgi:hypothetical protein